MAVTLQCYNKGCGQKFDPADNKSGKRTSAAVEEFSVVVRSIKKFVQSDV